MQTSFLDLEYAAKKKHTRRDRFLGDLEQLVPWAALVEALDPHYPKSGRRGRPPIGLEPMLRLYMAQQCFGLSDEKVEHPFQVIKQRFGHRKARYRGLAKNQTQLYTPFGLANRVLARRRLLETCV
jgi:IS5 family transposase